MKLSAYQEGLLKNISSIKKRREKRSDMKTLIKGIERDKWMLEEFMSNPQFPNAIAYQKNLLSSKTKQLAEIENSLKEKN